MQDSCFLSPQKVRSEQGNTISEIINLKLPRNIKIPNQSPPSIFPQPGPVGVSLPQRLGAAEAKLREKLGKREAPRELCRRADELHQWLAPASGDNAALSLKVRMERRGGLTDFWSVGHRRSLFLGHLASLSGCYQSDQKQSLSRSS